MDYHQTAGDLAGLSTRPTLAGPGQGLEIPRERAVHTALTACDSQLNSLEKAVSELSRRLEMALRSRPPSADKEAVSAEPPCALAACVESQATRIRALRIAIDDLLDRLEL